MKRSLCLVLCAMLLCAFAIAQSTVGTDVLGVHNMSPGGPSKVKGNLDPCLFCHAPHSGLGKGPLWSQKLATGQNYTLYGTGTSSTVANSEAPPVQGSHSNLCLSCHDGTVAPGETTPYGSQKMPALTGSDSLTTNLTTSHPFSLNKSTLKDSPDLVSTLIGSGKTADITNSVNLVDGNVECVSCHNPHAQSIDMVSQNFLVLDNSDGKMCLACHEVNARTVASKSNPLVGWTGNIHATADNKIASTTLGNYSSVGHNGCISCHQPHNASSGARLLRNPVPPVTNVDAATQNCMTCHNGGTNISPAIPNIYAEFAKKAHPYPSSTNVHDASEAAVLNNNRHATCVDCHNPHSSMREGAFTAAPAIRLAQNGAVGVSATDGTTVLTPALNQYETCLRCHGSSTNKPKDSALGYIPNWLIAAADPFDIRQQFGTTAISSHPVMHARMGNLQPSLLNNMLSINGSPTGRDQTASSTQIFCTDCHNSDDNREIGGSGPVGPHGSQYNHIFERRYDISQVGAGGPGSLVQNLNIGPPTNPDCSTYPCVSPYALCAKCHNLDNVLSDAAGSFKYHNKHVSVDGFSCSVCHTGHGVPLPGTTTGQRLVNFDINVVAPNASGPISYDPGTQSCTLTCHGHQHGL